MNGHGWRRFVLVSAMALCLGVHLGCATATPLEGEVAASLLVLSPSYEANLVLARHCEGGELFVATDSEKLSRRTERFGWNVLLDYGSDMDYYESLDSSEYGGVMTMTYQERRAFVGYKRAAQCPDAVVEALRQGRMP